MVTSTSSRRSNVVSAATAGLRGDNSRAGDERARGNLPPRELILSAKDLIIAKDSFSVLAARQVYVMAKRPRSFDTKSFLARVGDGQSVGKYRKGQIVFSQGDAGDAVFYIQKG